MAVKGSHLSPETKARLSASRRAQGSPWRKGQKHDDATRARMSGKIRSRRTPGLTSEEYRKLDRKLDEIKVSIHDMLLVHGVSPDSEHVAEARRERHALEDKIAHARLREAAFNHYGWFCGCCGEHEIRFLTIDHINNDGAEDRRIHGIASRYGGVLNLYRSLKHRGYPKGFQVLCYNCNCSKGIYGVCPHAEVAAGLIGTIARPKMAEVEGN